MASTESRKRKQEEYEMQLFGFHSRAVYTTLKNIIYERIQYKVKKLCETIAKTYKLNSEKLMILGTNQKQLEKAYRKGAATHLGSIENAVNTYITVPSNVLLEEDKCQRTQYNDAEFASITENLENLQQRAKRATILNAALKEELQVIEQFTTYKENADKMCKDIETRVRCPDIDNTISELIEVSKQCVTNTMDAKSASKKVKYNAINTRKYEECDFDSL